VAEHPSRLERSPAGLPIYTFVPDPNRPPVSVLRIQRGMHQPPRASGPHVHDFPALAYFERGGGSLHSGNRHHRIQAGDLYVIAPGDVIAVGGLDELDLAEGSGVFFTPDALGPHRPEPLLSWRAHPLLFPFVRGSAGGALRLSVPVAERPAWVSGITAIEKELGQRRDGYRQAALAHLVLLLVSVSRLASDVVSDLRVNDERLLAEVFAVIEQRYRGPLSLRDVARAVNLTPGHLTTTVRRKTGRTVQDWITERRMNQARRLLVETDLSMAEIARMVGYRDPSYFTRSFRRAHGVSPRVWRHTGAHLPCERPPDQGTNGPGG
jgi:AraC-like DNA-binding protein